MSEIVALVSDLIFRSKIKEICLAKGRALGFAKSQAQLEPLLADSALAPKLIVIDLALKDLDPLGAIDQVRAAWPNSKIVCFASHLEVQLMNDAKSRGVSQVLPRSSFVAELPALIENG